MQMQLTKIPIKPKKKKMFYTQHNSCNENIYEELLQFRNSKSKEKNIQKSLNSKTNTKPSKKLLSTNNITEDQIH